MKENTDIATASLKTIRHLGGIGIRVAGTRQEKAAANWIEIQFRNLGLDHVQQQEFPCLSFGCRDCVLQARNGAVWERIPAEAAAHSPSTHREWLEAELAVIEQISGVQHSRPDQFRGKAVLIYTSVFFRLEHLKQIMAAGPAVILVVDDRFPGDWTVAVGFPRAWIELLRCPVVNIPFEHAWNLVRGETRRVRVRVHSFVKKAVSENVIGEIRGTSVPSEAIIISAHHDSVANNPGWDDNGSGIAVLLELARRFAAERPRRTLRFVSFGAEEQLSEGARCYAKTLRTPRQVRLDVNIDSVSAVMGRTAAFCTGSADLAELIRDVNSCCSLQVEVVRQLSPFSDHFPLALRGIPTVWYYRPTYAAGRHFHHSRRETMRVVSGAVLERTVLHLVELIGRVANEKRLPFSPGLSALQKRALKKMAQEWMPGLE